MKISVWFVLFLTYLCETGIGFSSSFRKISLRPITRLNPLKGSTTANFHTGMMIISSGAPCKLMEFLHVKPGKGGAFVRTKFRNLLTKSILEKTFRAGESIEKADISTIGVTYSFQKRDEYVFMAPKEKGGSMVYRCPYSVLGPSITQFLIPKLPLKLMLWNEKVIDAILPPTVAMEVVSCTTKGNSVSSKHATLESGVVITVPSFISEGEAIIVNTATKEYSCRERIKARKKLFKDDSRYHQLE